VPPEIHLENKQQFLALLRKEIIWAEHGKDQVFGAAVYDLSLNRRAVVEVLCRIVSQCSNSGMESSNVLSEQRKSDSEIDTPTAVSGVDLIRPIPCLHAHLVLTTSLWIFP